MVAHGTTSRLGRVVIGALALVALAVGAAAGSPLARSEAASGWTPFGANAIETQIGYLKADNTEFTGTEATPQAAVGDTIRMVVRARVTAPSVEALYFSYLKAEFGGVQYGPFWPGSTATCNPSAPEDGLPVGTILECISEPFTLEPTVSTSSGNGFALAFKPAGGTMGGPAYVSYNILGRISSVKAGLTQNEPTLTTDRTDGAVEVGDTVVFNFTATNTGSSAWADETMTDALGLSYTCTPKAVPVGGTTTCTSADYTVTAADLAAGTISNTGHISATSGSGYPGVADSAEKTVVVRQALAEPSIELTKTAVSSVARGGSIEYVLTVTNTGEKPTKEVATVTDPIPAQIDAATATANTASGSIAKSGNVVVWHVPAGIAAGGQVSATISGNVLTSATPGAGALVNTATAESSECGTKCTAQATSDIEDTKGRLELTKTAPGSEENPVHPETPVQYRFTVRNAGDVPLTNVTVKDTTAIFADSPIVCAGSGNATIPTLAVGASTTCTMAHTFTETEFVVARSSIEQSFTNNAEATATDPNGVPVVATASAKTYLELDTDVSMTKTITSPAAGTKIKAGDTIKYKITFRYAPESEATLTVNQWEDPLLPDFNDDCSPKMPARLTPGFTTTCEGPNLEHVVTEDEIRDNWTNGFIRNQVSFASILYVWPGQTLTGWKTVDQPIDKNVPMVQFAGSKTVDKSAAVPGDTLTYTVTARNTGQLTATDVVLKDSFKGATATQIDPADCIWPGAAGTLKAGEQVTCEYTYDVTDADANTTITNKATAEGLNGSDQVGPTDLGDTSVTVASGADLWATKTASVGDGARVKPGQEFDYTIRVENRGGTAAHNVAIEDQLPAGLEYYPTDQAGWTFAGQHAQTAAGSEFDVAPSGHADKTVSVRVKSNAEGEQTLKNVAVVKGMASLSQCDATPTTQGCAVHTAGVVVDDSSLTITKKSLVDPVAVGAPKQVKIGQEFRYELFIRNSGISPVTGETITDQLPDGLAFASATQNGWQPLSGSVATSLKLSLGADESTTLYLNVVVTNAARAGATLTNISAIDSMASIAECQANNDKQGCGVDKTPVTVVDHSKVTIAKSNDVQGDVKRVKVSDSYLYTITVKNTGTTTAYGVQVTDTLPDQLTTAGIAQSSDWTQTGQTLSLRRLVDLAPDEELTFSIRVKVAPGASGEINNAAALDDRDSTTCPVKTKADGCGPDLDPPTVDNTDVSLTKTSGLGAGASVKPGDPVTYTLTARNAGTEPASGRTVTDMVPEGTRLDSASITGWRLVSGSGEAGSVLESDPFTLAPSGGTKELSFTVIVLDTAKAGDKIRNVATVGPTPIDECVGTMPAAGPGCAEDNTQPTVDNSKIVIAKSNDAGEVPLVMVGDKITYTISVENTGDSNASGVRISDVLPAGLALDPSSKQAGWEIVDAATGTVRSLPLSLAGHSPKTYLYLDVVVVNPAKAGDTLTNVAAVDGVATPAECAADKTHKLDGCAWDEVPLQVTDHSKVSISKVNDVKAPKVVRVSDTYVYTIRVENKGEAPALGVMVSDTLPASLDFDGAQADDWAISGKTIFLLTPVDLEPGEWREYDVKVKVLRGASGRIDNVAVLDDTDPATCVDPMPATCGPDKEPPTVDNTDVELKKSSGLGANARVKPGQSYTYTFTANNYGTEDATGVTITDQLPEQVTLDPDPQSGWTAGADGVIVSDPFTVPAGGEPVTKTVRVKVVSDATSGDVIRNIGTVGPTPIDECVSDPKGQGCAEDDQKPVVDDSNILISKSTDTPNEPKLVRLGQKYTYTIKIQNTGVSQADRVQVIEKLPAGLAFDPDSAQPGWITPISGDTATSLALTLPGRSPVYSLPIDVVVVDPAKAGDVLTNIAAVAGVAKPEDCASDGGHTLKGCAWDTTVTVVDHSKVEIHKANTLSADPKLVKVGDTYRYTIDVVNGGDETAYSVYVSDTLPAGLEFDGSQAPWTLDGNTAHITIDVPKGATVPLSLSVRVSKGASGYLHNVAVMDEQDPGECDVDAESHGCAPDLDPPRVDNTKVTLSKSNTLPAGARVRPNATYTYTFTATNTGSEAATGITLTDQLPAQVEFYPSDQDGWNLSGSGIVTSDPFDLSANGGSRELSFQVRVKADAEAETKIRNVGTVGPTSIADCVSDPKALGAGCAQDDNQPTVDQSAIQIRKFNSLGEAKLVRLGSTYRYTIAVQNTGDSPAANVVIADQLPAGLAFDPASSQPGWAKIDKTARTATSLALNLPAHSEETYLYLDVVVVDPAKAGDELTNVAAVTLVVDLSDCVADTSQTLTGCAWDQAPVTVTDHSGVKVSKSNNVSAPYVVTPGQEYTYTVTLKNNGTKPALGVQFFDAISDKLTIVTPLSDLLKIDGQTVSLKTPVDLAVNQSESYDIKVKVKDGAKGTIDNVAVMEGQDPGTCDDATDACGQDPHPPTINNTNLSLEKDSGLPAGTRLKAGAPITYTFTARNTGIEDATDVTITDQLPSQVALDPDPQDGWKAGSGTGVIVSDPFTVPAGGAPVTKTVRVVVLDTAKAGDQIRNVGTVGPTPIAECVATPKLPGCAEDANVPIFDDSALTVVKVNDVGTAGKSVTVGQTFHYTLTVHNSGESTATGVTITDQVPSYLEVLSPDPLAWETIGENLLRSKPFSLAGGKDQELSLTVKVKDGTPTGTQLTNVSAIDSMKTIEQCTASPTDPGCGVDQAPVHVVDHSKVKIVKSNDIASEPKVVKAGQSFHYTLTVTNTDTSPAYNVLVTDTLPAGLEYSGAQSGWTLTDGVTATRTIAQLDPDKPVEYRLTVRVVDGATGQLRNVAVIDDQDPDQCPTSGAIPPNCGPDLDPPSVDNTDVTLTKTSGLAKGARVKLGQPYTYTFTATNEGSETATGVVITDQLPAEVTIDPANQPDWNEPDSNGVITSKPFDVAPGTPVIKTLSVKVLNTASSGALIRNIGTVGPTDIASCVTDPSLPGCAEDDREPIVDDSVITIRKANNVDGAPIVTAKTKVRYTITVANSGKSDADGVIVVDKLPAGLIFDPASAQAGWSVDPATGIATSAPMTVPGTSEWPLYLDTIVADDADLGRLTNVAALKGTSTPDECLADQDRTRTGCAWDETLTVVDHSKVDITKTNQLVGAPPTVRVGTVFTYTITASNTDTRVAKSVTITDTLPDYLELTGSQDKRWRVTNGNRTLSYTSDIQPGTPIELPVTVRVIEGATGSITNVATLDDTDPTDCQATGDPWGCAVDPNPPRVDNTRLTIAKTHEGVEGNRVRVGEEFTYVFTLTNTGSEDATGVTLTDLLPAGVESAPGSGAGWEPLESATRHIRSLPVTVPAGGNPVRIELKVRVAAGTAPLTKIVNVGSLDGTTPVDQCLTGTGATLPNGCAKDETPLVVDDSAISLSKDNDIEVPRQVQRGEWFTYTVHVTNSGQAEATDVQVTDQLPSGLAFHGTQDTTYWATANPSGTTIQSVKLTVPGKTTVDLPLTVEVTKDAVIGAKLINVAALDGTATPAECAADTEHVTIGCAWDETGPIVVDHSAVKVAKSNDLPGAAESQPRVAVGQEFSYTITATNTATSGTARGVVLRDTLPAGLGYVLPLPDGWRLDGNTITSDPALDIKAGDTAELKVKVVVLGGASGTLRNVAVRDGQDPAGCDPQVADNACGTDPRPPYVDTVELTKEAVGQDRVKPGELVTYTFTATNTGHHDIATYRIIDSIPLAASLDPNPQDGWSIVSGTGQPGTIVQTSEPFEVKAGQAVSKTLTVRVAQDAASGHVIRNIATMADGRTPIADCVADPTKPDCVTDKTNPVVDDSNVVISKRNDIDRTPVTVQAKDTFTYWITVTNNGATPAAGVQVSDQLPAGLAFAPTQDSAWLTPKGDTIQSAKLTVTKGTPIELPIKVVVLDEAKVGTSLVNVAALDGVATLKECAEDTTKTLTGCAWDKTAPSVVDHSGVEVTKSNDVSGTPKLVKPGETYRYTVTATNTDASVEARGVVLHDTLPAGLTFAAQTDARWKAPVGASIASEPLDIAPKASVKLTLVVTVADNASGQLHNAATKDDEPAPDCTAQPVPAQCDGTPPTVDTVILTKQADQARVAPGGTVTYTFRADNTAGRATVPGYRIIDSIPQLASLDPNPQDGWSIVTGTGTAGTIVQSSDQFDVPAGEVVTKTLTVKIDQDATAGRVIRNVATMESGRTPIDECVGDPSQIDCVSDTTKPVVDDSAIQLKKDNSLTGARTVMAGEDFYYYVTVTNTGAMPAQGVQVTDRLPEGLEFFGEQDSAWQTPTGSEITSTKLTVAKGSPIRLPIHVRVLDTAKVNQTLVNVVALDGTVTPDQCLADDSQTRTGCAWDKTPPSVVDHSQVTVAKSNDATGEPKTVKPGQTYSYEITVTNTDPLIDARDVTVTDVLPVGLLFAPQTDARWNAPIGQTITSTKLLVPAGKPLTLTLRVQVAPNATGVLRNAVVKDGGTAPDCAANPTAPGCDPEPPQVNTVTPRKHSDVADGARVKPGQLITYTLIADNATGRSDVAGYGFIDQVPAGMSLDPADQQAAGWKVVSGTGGAGTIVRSEPTFTVPAGGSVSKTLTMRVDPNATNGMTIRNVGTIVGGETNIDGCVANPTLPDCFEEDTEHAVDDSAIRIAKTNDVPQSHKLVTPGQAFTYTITVENTGQSDATGVRITDALPAGLAFASGQDSAWGAPSADGKTIVSNPMTVKAGQPVKLPLRVVVQDGATGTLVNIAAVNGMATIDECKADRLHVGCAWDASPLTVDNTKVIASKKPSIGANAQVKPGQTFFYTITARNDGTEQAQAVTITDKLPAGLILDPEQDSADFTTPAVAGVVTSKPFDLQAKGSKELTLYVKVDPAASAGTIIKNVGTITKDTDDGPSLDECKTTPKPAKCFEEPGEHEVNDSVISLSKRAIVSANPPEVLRGESYTYEIVATNNGESVAEGVTITDQLPTGVVFDGKQDSAWGEPQGATITSEPFTLLGHRSRTLSLTVKVNETASIGTTLTNVAAVDSMATPAECLAGTKVAGCAIDQTKPKVVDHSGVEVTKANSLTGTPPRVQVGDTYSYTITATNKGTTQARGVVISDTLPTGLELTGTQDSRWIVSAGNRTLTYVTTLDAGQAVSLPINVKVATGASGTIENGAEIDGNSVDCDTDPKPAGCDENGPWVDTVVPAKVSDVADGARVKPGQAITYTFKAVNTGDRDVASYGFIDQVPAGMILDQADATANGWKIVSGTGTAGTVVQSNPLFAVPKGATVTKTLKMQVDPHAVNGVVIRNVGTVVNGKTPIDGCVANPTKDDCYQEPTDHAVDDSDITLIKTNDIAQSHKMVKVGESFTYTIAVTNSGASTAKDVQITDKLPAGLVFDGIQDTNFWQAPLDESTIQSVAFDVAGHATKNLTLRVKVGPNATGRLVNVSALDAKVTPDQCEANWTLSGCGVDQNPAQVDNTAVSATKKASVGDTAPLKPGQAYSYTITAANTGSQAARGVTVKDQIPTGLAWVASTDFPTPPLAGVATSRAFDLEAGSGLELTLSVKVLDNAAAGSTIRNIGAITKPTDDGPGIDECVKDPTLPQCFLEPGDHTVDDSNISIVKTNGLAGNPPLVTAGDTFTYDLVVTNSGNSTDNRVVVTDVLPDGLTFAPAAQSGWTIAADGKHATYQTFSLAGKTSTTLHLSVRVGEGMATGTVVKNVSAVKGSTSGGTDVDDCAAKDTQPGCGPDKNPPEVVDHSKVEITKTNNLTGKAPIVRVGDSYAYTITATNKGTKPVTKVLVSDTLPAGLAFAGLQPGWTIQGDTASFTTDLKVGESVSKTLAVTVMKGATGTLYNVAVKDADQPGSDECAVVSPPPACDANPPSVDNTDVSIVKKSSLAAGSRVKPGQQFSYTLTATNNGTEVAKGVAITDTLPTGLTYVAANGDGWTTSGNGRTLTSSAFDLLPNGDSKSFTLTVKVTTDAQPGAVIANTGCTTGLNSNVCGADDDPPVYDDSDIQLTKTNDTAKWSRQVKVGDTFRYTITATNRGHSTAEKVVVTDSLPRGLEFASATQSGWATLTGRDATSAPFTIEGGKSVTLTLDVTVTSAATTGDVLKNYVAVDGETTPGQCETNENLPGCGHDTDPPTVVDHSKITIAKTSSAAGAIVKPGDSYTYTISVANADTRDAHGITVSDTLPAGLVFDGSQPGWTLTDSTATRTIESLKAGAHTDFTLRVKVAASASTGKLRNVAVIDDRDPATCLDDPALPGCGVDPNPPSVDASVIKLSKANSLGSLTTVYPGQTFSYTITASNAGTGPATDVKVVDTLPDGLEFYPASQSGWVLDGATATTSIPSVAAGQSTTLTLHVRVVADVPAGTMLRNAARAIDPSRPDGGDNPADCLSDPTIVGCGVDPKPPVADRDVMQILKTHSLGAGSLLVTKGQPFGYDITVRNLGYLDAKAVSVADRLPDGVAWDGTSQAGWASMSGPDAVSKPFTVTAGGSTTLHVATEATKTSTSLLRNVVALTGWQMAGQTITATGVTGGAASSPPTGIGHTIEQCVNDPTQAGCAYDDIAGSGQRDAVSIVKSNNAPGGIVKVGDTYTYTITVTNTSSAASRGITVSDTLPTGLVYAPSAQEGWTITGTKAEAGPFDLGAAQSKTLTLRVQVTKEASGAIRNVAVLDDRDPADCMVNPSLIGCGLDPKGPIVDAGSSTLSLVKSGASTDVNLNGVMDAGDTIEYTFTVTNTGTAAADAPVQIIDPMLAAAGIQIVCPADPIEPGAQLTCIASAPYVLTVQDQMAGLVRNTAAAASGDVVSRPASFEVTTSGEVDCSQCASCPSATGSAATPCTTPGAALPTAGGAYVPGTYQPADTLPNTGGTGGYATYPATNGTGAGTAGSSWLPHTGAQIGVTALIALLLAGLGGYAVFHARRRRGREEG